MKHLTQKTKNYTVHTNHSIRDNRLTLRAKGLHILMLSLPDDWEFSVKGLASICKEGTAMIRSALKELEAAGYLRVTKNLPSKECCRITYSYDIYEIPPTDEPDSQDIGFQGIDTQVLDGQGIDRQGIENCPQINIDNKIKTDKIKTDKKKEREPLSPTESDEPLNRALTRYIGQRKSAGKPLSKIGYEALLEKLNSMSRDKAVQAEILNQSVRSGWTGIYMPKTDTPTNKPPEKSLSYAEAFHQKYTTMADTADSAAIERQFAAMYS